MGIITKGILGGFSGTVGTVIGSTWKGISYMKSQPAKKSGAASPKQLEQYAKFKTSIRFVSSMNGLVMLSFRNYAVKMTGANNAFAYTIKNAVTGVYPNYTIDYSMALVSRGDLPNATNPAANSTTGNIVTYNWTDNTGMGKAKADDKAILAVYCPDLNLTLYTTGSAARSAAIDTLDCTLFTGKLAQTYIGFISEDGKDIASSIYTGDVTVSP